MAPWLIDRVTAVGVEPALTACVLLWLRLLPLFVVLPWLALRSAPSLALVLASVAGGLVLTALAFAGGVPLLREGVPLMAAGASELARGAVLAIGCALPWTLLGATGVLSDALRGA